MMAWVAMDRAVKSMEQGWMPYNEGWKLCETRSTSRFANPASTRT